jgi:molybdopterin-binding protein
MKSTVRNHFEGTIREIIQGEAVSEIDVDTAAGVVSAVVTTRSLKENGLKVGDRVVAAFKATNVFLEKP